MISVKNEIFILVVLVLIVVCSIAYTFTWRDGNEVFAKEIPTVGSVRNYIETETLSKTKLKTKKFPDVIIIGSKKSGTGQ